jgi:predicted GNAT family acetyltransferase
MTRTVPTAVPVRDPAPPNVDVDPLTDAEFRGHGLASRLVQAVVADVRDRGATALLHTSARNVTAIGLYEQLGFELRRRTTFSAYRVPA